MATKAKPEPAPFAVGDVVRVRSGGPAMTVKEVDPDGQHISVVWWGGEKHPMYNVMIIAALVEKCEPDRFARM